jgi:hypothetical protein
MLFEVIFVAAFNTFLEPSGYFTLKMDFDVGT